MWRRLFTSRLWGGATFAAAAVEVASTYLFLIRVSRAHPHALFFSAISFFGSLGYCILEHLSADLFSFLGTGLVSSVVRGQITFF